jgi:dipeptidyl aminopeptidase/acylaminoacyl peptidase
MRKEDHPAAMTGALVVCGILLASFFLGCTGRSFDTTGIPPIPDAFCKRVARYQSWNFAAFADWTAKGAPMVVLSRSGQTNQIHIVKEKMAVPRQFSFLAEPVTSVFVCPDPARDVMLFTQDEGGDENFQIFLTGLDTCNPVLLTDGLRSQNDGIVWSNAGDRFAFQSNKRNGIDFDIYISDIRTARPVPSRVLARGGAWSCLDWSPDDKKLLVQKYRSRNESWIAILDIATGSILPLCDTTDTVSQESAVWAANGPGIFLTSDAHSAFRCLRYYDCRTCVDTVLTRDLSWDVREIDMSRDRTRLAFMTNENGFSRVYLMNTATFAYREIPNLPRGGIYHLRFDPSGSSLGMIMDLPRHPEECYSVRLRDFALETWTQSHLDGLDTLALSAPELIHYPTFDSVAGKPRLIPCFLYEPPQNRHGPFPVLIFVHGGPESQFWPYFSALVQCLVNELGIAVLAPNVRGSGGYGRRYLQLDDTYKRVDAVRDIGALLDWTAHRGGLDTSRVAIMGGSYGGYMALASMAGFRGRIACGIDLYGISSFVTFLEHTSAYRRDLRRAEYGDERDPRMRGFLDSISPLSQSTRIAKPLFIIQGANDPRVPLEESRQIASAVRKNNCPVWMLVAADEGHGYRKKSNIDFQECAEAFFLQTYLLPQKRNK